MSESNLFLSWKMSDVDDDGAVVEDIIYQINHFTGTNLDGEEAEGTVLFEVKPPEWFKNTNSLHRDLFKIRGTSIYAEQPKAICLDLFRIKFGLFKPYNGNGDFALKITSNMVISIIRGNSNTMTIIDQKTDKSPILIWFFEKKLVIDTYNK